MSQGRAQLIGQKARDQLEWLVVHEAQALDLDDRRVGFQVQAAGDPRVGRDDLLLEDLGDRRQPLLDHVLVETGQLLNQAFLNLGLGHKRAFALLAHDQAPAGEIAKRLADDGAADGKHAAQLGLTGQPVAWVPGSRPEMILQGIANLDVVRNPVCTVDLERQTVILLSCHYNRLIVL